MRQIIVFTDLDGTLLDHHSYSYAPAAVALAGLRRRGIPLILNSSKTAQEMLLLRKELCNHDPFVVENGGALFLPLGRAEDAAGALMPPCEEQVFGCPYPQILSVLHRLRRQGGYLFRGFSDMTASEVAAATGLDTAAAARAQARASSEPVQWQDSAAALKKFAGELAAEGLRLVRGGRFWHVSGPADKGMAVRWLIEHYRQLRPDAAPLSIALGDSPNDLPMLAAVDIPVVIPASSGSQMALPADMTAIRPGLPGPAGWQLAMDEIFLMLKRKGIVHG